MLKRNLFTVVVMLGLILSAAFTSWTQNTSDPGVTSPPAARSFPPDSTNYARPATSLDAAQQTKSLSAPGGVPAPAFVSGPGFFLVEVPNSAGGEPDLAINPADLSQIVVHAGFGGWNGDAPNEVSNDGGLTWTQASQIPPPPGAPNAAGCPCDITHDWGMDGNLYGTYLTGNTDVFSASNTNPILGGLFSYFLVGPNAQLTNFNGHLGQADQPQLLTNRDPTTPGQTNTYVAYDDFFPNPPVATRVSVSFGASPPNFTTDNVTGSSTGGGVNPGHRLAVDPGTGAVYSLYQICTANCGGSPKTIGYKLNRSLDAGATWTLNGSGTGIAVASGSTIQPTPKFGTVNALLGGIDHAAVDPTTGNLFVVYGDDNGSGGNAVFIKQITFDGATPSNAITTNTPHQVSLPGAQAALPAVAVAGDGTVGVLYTSFDGFSGDGFPIYSGHFAYSTDAGATFTDRTLLTFQSPAKEDGNINDSQRVLGDYQQLKVVSDPPPGVVGNTFYGVFTGNGAALGDPIANNDAIFFKITLSSAFVLNSDRVQIVHSTAPNSDQVNMGLTFRELGIPACEAGEDALNDGVDVALFAGTCAGLPGNGLELMLSPFAVHTVNLQSYGTLLQKSPPEIVSARMVALPTPLGACGQWTLNLEVTGLDTAALGLGGGNPFALVLSDLDLQAWGCFDITNAIVGNQIPPGRRVRRGVRR